MTILYALIFLGFVILSKFVYDSVKKNRLFKKLKVGDKILVWIYSDFCECTKEAIVTKEYDGEFISAKIENPEKFEECVSCHSINESGNPTCGFSAQLFRKNDICKKL